MGLLIGLHYNMFYSSQGKPDAKGENLSSEKRIRRESMREERDAFLSRKKGRRVRSWGGGRRASLVALGVSYV